MSSTLGKYYSIQGGRRRYTGPAGRIPATVMRISFATRLTSVCRAISSGRQATRAAMELDQEVREGDEL
jgi:hypothetical protein